MRLKPDQVIRGHIFSHHDTLLNTVKSSQAGCYLYLFLFNTGLVCSKKHACLDTLMTTEEQSNFNFFPREYKYSGKEWAGQDL